MKTEVCWVPEAPTLVRVRTQTLHNWSLLRPSQELNDHIAGVLSRALGYGPVKVCAATVLPDEWQAVVVVGDETRHLPDFMCFANSNMATEAGRGIGWSGKFWAAPYESTVVSNEEEAQVAQLKEVLGLAVKRGYVERPEDWPGLHCAQALVGDGKLKGHWHDRTREYELRRRGKEVDSEEILSEETVELEPLPSWKEKKPQERVELARQLIAEIIAEGKAERAANGEKCRGAALMKMLDVRKPPPKVDGEPLPRFIAVDPEVLRELAEAYETFLVAYRLAAQRPELLTYPPASFRNSGLRPRYGADPNLSGFCRRVPCFRGSEQLKAGEAVAVGSPRYQKPIT